MLNDINLKPVENENLSYGDLEKLIVARFRLWPGLAPGETDENRGRYVLDERQGKWRRYDVSCPEVVVFRPETIRHDSLVIVIPGGGYNNQSMGKFYRNAKPVLDSGRWVAVLYYRVPRREGRKIYDAPREDAVRAIRLLRSMAKDFGYSPDKIGAVGYSAGAHLAAISAVSSTDKVYDPIDEVDALPCNLSFAIPVYSAYIADDGATGPNVNRGDGAEILPEFKFDAMTPPMFMIHGDLDQYSPMGAVLLYQELHKRKINAQLFIFSGVGHGLGDTVNCIGWQERVVDWIESIGY